MDPPGPPRPPPHPPLLTAASVPAHGPTRLDHNPCLLHTTSAADARTRVSIRG